MHLILLVTQNTPDNGRVNGAVVNLTDALRKRIRSLRRLSQKSGAEIVVQNDEPTWVDDLEPKEPLNEMHATWDPNDHEVTQVEFLSEAYLHVNAEGFWWTCNEATGDEATVYETTCVPFKYVERRPKRKTLEQIHLACTKLWAQELAVKREVTYALAEIIRRWLDRHPTAEWVQVYFGKSEQEGEEVWASVTDSLGRHGGWQLFPDDICNELTQYPVFDYAFTPGDFVRVTKDKIFVKKGWKARCQ